MDRGTDVVTKAGDCQFGRTRTAAYRLIGFEQYDRNTVARQLGRRGEPVRAAADHDRIELLGHDRLPHLPKLRTTAASEGGGGAKEQRIDLPFGVGAFDLAAGVVARQEAVDGRKQRRDYAGHEAVDAHPELRRHGENYLARAAPDGTHDLPRR